MFFQPHREGYEVSVRFGGHAGDCHFDEARTLSDHLHFLIQDPSCLDKGPRFLAEQVPQVRVHCSKRVWKQAEQCMNIFKTDSPEKK
jgi:hypothetical protein